MQCNDSIKVKVLRKVFAEYSKDEIIKNRIILESIKGAKSEELIVDKFYEFGLYKNYVELDEAALSKYAGVRESARFYMKKLGQNNFYEFYRDKLECGKNKKYALLGLCEVCTVDNMKVLSGYFDSATSKVKKKILKRIIDLSEYGMYDDYSIFIKGINSKNLGVIKLCREYMSKNYEMFSTEEILEIYEHGKEKLTRESAVSILCLGNSWEALSYILKFLLVKDEDVYKIALSNLRRWISEKKAYVVSVEEGRYSHYLLHKMNNKNKEKIKKLFNDNKELYRESLGDEYSDILRGLILQYSE